MLDREYYRWLYTAFTRPVEKLYLVNFNKGFLMNRKNSNPIYAFIEYFFPSTAVSVFLNSLCASFKNCSVVL